VTVRAKELRFETRLEPDGSFSAGSEELRPPEAWTAEDLVLAGLLRCLLTSLRYSAARLGIALGPAGGVAQGTVSRREEDGRYAFVSVEVEIAAKLVSPVGEAQRTELAQRAEQGCFVGASLTAKPHYTWRLG